MNDTISVTTNGSWVTMIVNTSAGSSGARRAQSADRRSAPPGGGPGGRGGVGGGGCSPRPRPVWRVLVLIALPSPGVVLPARSLRLPLLVALGDVRGELLSPGQHVVDGHPPGDRGADVLGHL